MENPPCSPQLVPNEFWLSPNVKERRFQDSKDIQKKCDDGAENCSTGVLEMFSTVAASLG
jgi:hypothetical protein